MANKEGSEKKNGYFCYVGSVAASLSSCFEGAGGAQQREGIFLRLRSQERPGLMGSIGEENRKRGKRGRGKSRPKGTEGVTSEEVWIHPLVTRGCG